jgi:hypothetical protein
MHHPDDAPQVLASFYAEFNVANTVFGADKKIGLYFARSTITEDADKVMVARIRDTKAKRLAAHVAEGCEYSYCRTARLTAAATQAQGPTTNATVSFNEVLAVVVWEYPHTMVNDSVNDEV